jgi:hypothetical protein
MNLSASKFAARFLVPDKSAAQRYLSRRMGNLSAMAMEADKTLPADQAGQSLAVVDHFYKVHPHGDAGLACADFAVQLHRQHPEMALSVAAYLRDREGPRFRQILLDTKDSYRPGPVGQSAYSDFLEGAALGVTVGFALEVAYEAPVWLGYVLGAVGGVGMAYVGRQKRLASENCIETLCAFASLDEEPAQAV